MYFPQGFLADGYVPEGYLPESGTTYNETANGGIVAGSAANVYVVYNTTIIGGSLGSSTAEVTYDYITFGGVLGSSTATALTTYNPAVTGGDVAGGAADVYSGYGIITAGGVQIVGVAEHSYSYTVSGGVLANGESYLFVEQYSSPVPEVVVPKPTRKMGDVPTDRRSGCYSMTTLSKATLLSILPVSRFKTSLQTLPKDRWRIASFNPAKRVACIEIDSGAQINVTSVTVPQIVAHMRR